MSGEMGPYSKQCGCVGDPWTSSRSRRPLQQWGEGWLCSTAAHHPAYHVFGHIHEGLQSAGFICNWIPSLQAMGSLVMVTPRLSTAPHATSPTNLFTLQLYLMFYSKAQYMYIHIMYNISHSRLKYKRSIIIIILEWLLS